MTATDLTASELRAMVSYDQNTGVFTRISPRSNSKVGDHLGSNHSCGYIVICINRKNRYAHRLAWLYQTGNWPTKQIDHINGDRADNRFANLRIANSSENSQNQRRATSKNTTGFLGVSRHRDGFGAIIRLNGKSLWLGLFKTPEEAHIAYVEAKRIMHPYSVI